MVDMVVKRAELQETLGRILGMMMQPAKEKLALHLWFPPDIKVELEFIVHP